MIDLTIYLVECSLLLGLLYLIYWTLLRKGRLFTINRFFLISVFALSFLIPLIDYELPFAAANYPYMEAPVATLSDARTAYYENLNDWMMSSVSTGTTGERTAGQDSTSWWLIGLISAYLTGLALALIRMGWVYFALLKLKNQGSREVEDGLTIVRLDQEIAPFSFLRYVFVSKDQATDDSFRQILDHERAHIRERHSIDLMIVQFLAALQWFNPAAWWLIKSLKTTHEYIADQQMISKGYSVVEYQTLLLQQLISNNSYGLVHNFNLSFIKKRIAMMKIQKIGWTSKTKMAMALSLSILIAVITVQCNARLDDPNLQAGASAGGGTEFQPASRPSYHASTDRAGHDSFELTIMNDQLYYDGKVTEISELEHLAREAEFSPRSAVLFSIDRNQTMAFVKQVQNELRRLDMRKVLYGGMNENGVFTGMPMLLPPLPGEWEAKMGTPEPDIEAMEANGEFVVLRLDLKDNERSQFQAQVHEFVTAHYNKDYKYVVSAKARSEITYQVYFENLSFVNEGFNQHYQDRADALYGAGTVTFITLNRDIPEEAEMYKTIRKGAPRSISVADD